MIIHLYSINCNNIKWDSQQQEEFWALERRVNLILNLVKLFTLTCDLSTVLTKGWKESCYSYKKWELKEKFEVNPDYTITAFITIFNHIPISLLGLKKSIMPTLSLNQ